MKKSRVILGVALLLGALFTTARIPYYNPHKLVQVSGIALKMQDDKIMAEFELFQPDADHHLGGVPEVVSAEGDSLDECVENLFKTYGKELFLRDSAVLLLADRDFDTLKAIVETFYKKPQNHHLNLRVFRWINPETEAFSKNKVKSLDIAESARMLDLDYTIADLIDQRGEPARIKGGEAYEILENR